MRHQRGFIKEEQSCVIGVVSEHQPTVLRRGLSNIFTVDLEDWYHGLELPRCSWARFEDRVQAWTEHLCGILEEAKTRATFFVLGHVAERHPRLVEWVSDQGHEIATHGYSHQFVYKQEPLEFAAELRRSICLLEDITGRPVLGHRAAFFSITRRSLWALELLAEAGLRYDSSIFPVYNYRYGMPRAPRNPFVLRNGSGPLIELPLSTVRVCGVNLPVAGGAYFRLWPYAFTRAALRRLNRCGKNGVFYIHPWELDAEQPRIPVAGRIGFTRYHRLAQTEGRLRRLLSDFEFAPAKTVLCLSSDNQPNHLGSSLCSTAGANLL